MPNSVLALDPGFHTGWAWWLVDRPQEQGVIEGGVEGFIPWARQRQAVNVLIIEDFIVEPNYVGRAWASEVKGAAIALIRYDKLVIQKRSDKATLFRENGKVVPETRRFQRLRNWGFSGTSHELDANTHALIYGKRSQNPRILSRYWNLEHEKTPD